MKTPLYRKICRASTDFMELKFIQVLCEAPRNFYTEMLCKAMLGVLPSYFFIKPRGLICDNTSLGSFIKAKWTNN